MKKDQSSSAGCKNSMTASDAKHVLVRGVARAEVGSLRSLENESILSTPAWMPHDLEVLTLLKSKRFEDEFEKRAKTVNASMLCPGIVHCPEIHHTNAMPAQVLLISYDRCLYIVRCSLTVCQLSCGFGIGDQSGSDEVNAPVSAIAQDV